MNTHTHMRTARTHERTAAASGGCQGREREEVLEAGGLHLAGHAHDHLVEQAGPAAALAERQGRAHLVVGGLGGWLCMGVCGCIEGGLHIIREGKGGTGWQ